MNKCPICGKDLRTRIEGSTQITECSSCDYSVATSYIDPIYEDNEDYRIIIDACETPDKKQYILLSKISGTNTLGVKKLLDKLPAELYVGKASDIKEIVSALNEAEIRYHIDPVFKY